MERWKEKVKSERGFTLIEILVVIGIMAVLAAVLIPRLVDTSDESKIQADVANKKLLQSAVERYYFDKGEYPVTGTDANKTAGTGSVDTATLVTGKYIVEAPKNPYTGDPADYKMTDGIVKQLK